MTSRRIITSEKTILDKDDDDLQPSSGAGGQSSIAPAVPMDVIIKLLAFTLAMVVVPIGSYFLTINTIFRGKWHNHFKMASSVPLHSNLF
ncbi:hypothetical protein E0Z10_g9379 [Xylaria hypoxylon]|uniref:Vacuolar ATPase assembly integral membrane protein VMA21 n=1 Tax=Xylaria hypoxylon TaxID=37992 RepID=A0A4Z0Y5S5_9PEZI|nr:hypothetical protein E0Z10_g9379 [Xylaria hypoxylon]